MNKKIAIGTTMFMIVVIVVVAIIYFGKRTVRFEDYEGPQVGTYIQVDTSSSEYGFRYKSTDECLRNICNEAGSSDYNILYVADDTEMYVYYVLVKNRLWYVIEDIDVAYYQEEDVLSLDEVLEELNRSY